jgi:hypothetical protein
MNTNLDTIRAILGVTPDYWLRLVQAVPIDLLARPPAEGHWSAYQCLQHIIDVELVFQSRLHAFLNGEESFPAFNPDAEGSQLIAEPSVDDLAEEFSRLRRESLDLIAAIGPVDLDRESRHQELGLVTLEMMINEWPAHDLNHTMQAERAVMLPFVEASGPWSMYFSAHEFSAEE